MDVPFHDKMVKHLSSVLSRSKKEWLPFYEKEPNSKKKLGYMRGPPKGTARMGVKIKDYQEEGYPVQGYPSSACLIDSIRGTVCVRNAEEVNEVFQLIKKNFKLCRVKNKYQRDVPFNNLMVNVMFDVAGLVIVGEIQI